MNGNHSIALAIRPKHGYIYEYMEENNLTAKELAERIGISRKCFDDILHFRWVPNDNSRRKEVAEKICSFFHCTLEDLFSRELVEILQNNKEIAGSLQNKQTIYKPEVELEFLADYTRFQALPGPDDFTNVEDKMVIDKVLDTLSPREQRIIRQIFYEGKNYKEIGKAEGLTGSRVMQIKCRALRKMQRPSRAEVLTGKK
ncbi:MAG: sigma-70 family RNA polymerase sigma factor [bacterium]